MRRPRCQGILSFCGCCAAVVLLAGCGGSGGDTPETVPVSGTVYLNDEPLEGADIEFISEEFASYGKTGPDGTFQLAQGAVPGENRVVISKMEGEDELLNPDEGIDEGQIEAMRQTEQMEGKNPAEVNLPHEVVPAEYSNPDETKLKFTVPSDGTDSADFRLTSSQ